MWFTPVATVATVRVEGVKYAQPAEITESSGVVEGQKMLRIDRRHAAENVVRLPWVKRATVSRSWPSTVVIEVVEHSPQLFIRGEPGQDRLISAQGEVFLTAAAPEGTTELVTPPEQEAEVIPAALEVLGKLPKEVREQLVRIDAPSPTAMTVVLVDDRLFYIGSEDSAADKGIAIRDVMGREENNWNVSNPEQPAVRP
nr:FtsQ-type POTRA domain-containing protein [Corynebacterium sp. TAE3-ERU12]